MLTGKTGHARTFVALAVGLLATSAAPAAVIPGTTLTPDVWWQADAPNNVVASGKVTQLTDQSGNGNNAVQNGSDTTPTLVPNDINGHSAVSFNGSSDSLISPTGAVKGNSPHTILIVTRFASTSTFAGGAVLYSGQSGGGSNSTLGAQSDGRLWVGGYAEDSTPYANASPDPASTLDKTHFYIADKIYNNGNYQGYLDRNQVINASGTVYNLGSTDTGVGRQFDTGTYYGGEIAEVLIFNSALSPTDRSAVEDYLGARYGITPEPGTLAVASVGSLLLLGRRRRQA